MTGSFEKKRTIQFPEGVTLGDHIDDFHINREYGCIRMVTGSTADVGACELPNDRAIAWIGSFLRDRIEHDVMNLFRKIVRQIPKSKSRPLLLDLRGNTGGSPELAGMLACALGGKEVSEQIDRFGGTASTQLGPNAST